MVIGHGAERADEGLVRRRADGHRPSLVPSATSMSASQATRLRYGSFLSRSKAYRMTNGAFAQVCPRHPAWCLDGGCGRSRPSGVDLFGGGVPQGDVRAWAPSSAAGWRVDARRRRRRRGTTRASAGARGRPPGGRRGRSRSAWPPRAGRARTRATRAARHDRSTRDQPRPNTLSKMASTWTR